jgi:polysaccharide export outer membrane protein
MLRHVVMGIGLVVLAGCASNESAEVPEIGQDYTEQVYQIGVGDELQVSVWREAELSVQLPVRPDGMISVPLAGDILAAGLTAEALGKNIAKELVNYVRNPQVTVIVTNPVSRDFQQRVRATGALASPTSVPYRKGMTVLDLVLMSGGLNAFADGNDTKLYRQTAEGMKVYPVFLDDILKKGLLKSNYTLLPSDVLTVPERAF